MLNLNHKKLDVWKLGIQLVNIIYKQTQRLPKYELYGLTSQLRRAAVSVPANIAEGSSRRTPNDRKRFYEIARSSLVEIDTLFEATVSANLLECNESNEISELMNIIFAKLSRLIDKTN
jgi:four helix bundle protein